MDKIEFPCAFQGEGAYEKFNAGPLLDDEYYAALNRVLNEFYTHHGDEAQRPSKQAALKKREEAAK